MLVKKFICFVILALFSSGLSAQHAADPLIYPDGGVVSRKPILFFWPDERTDPVKKLTFRVTVTGEKGSSFSQAVVPSAAGEYKYFELAADISAGRYSYKVEAYENNKLYKNAFSGYLKYPFSGSFEIGKNFETSNDSAEEIIRKYRAAHYNALINGYNGLFYGGASILSGAAAYLLLYVFDFNIITKVVGYIAAGSAVTGIGMSGYYTYQYVSFDEKNWQPQKSDESGKKITISFSGSF